MKRITESTKVSGGNSWELRIKDGEILGNVPTPHGYVYAWAYPGKKEHGYSSCVRLTFIWNGRRYQTNIDRKKPFTKRGVTRMASVWARNIVCGREGWTP
jgi:hypothetical protein